MTTVPHSRLSLSFARYVEQTSKGEVVPGQAPMGTLMVLWEYLYGGGQDQWFKEAEKWVRDHLAELRLKPHPHFDKYYGRLSSGLDFALCMAAENVSTVHTKQQARFINFAIREGAGLPDRAELRDRVLQVCRGIIGVLPEDDPDAQKLVANLAAFELGSSLGEGVVIAESRALADNLLADVYGLARSGEFKQAYRLALRHMPELGLAVGKNSPYGVGYSHKNLATTVCLGTAIALCNKKNQTQHKCADAAELLALLCKFGANCNTSASLWLGTLRGLERVLGPDNTNLEKIHALMLADELDKT